MPLHAVRLALVLTAVVAAGACASRGPEPVAGPAAEPPPTAEPSAGAEPSAAGAPGVVAVALAQQGVPYRWAGSDPSGFDCSGLVQYAFAQHGVALPRETAEQYTVGQPVALDALAPGDLVFFQTTSLGPSHVGIAIGGNRFVHAPSEGGVVRVERLTVIYWARRVLGARRIVAPDTLVADAGPAASATAPAAPPGPETPTRAVPRPAPFPGGPR